MLEYLYESGKNRYRVRVASWPNDAFEVLSEAEFAMLHDAVKQFPNLLTLKEIDDDGE